GWQVASRLLARMSLSMGWPVLVEPSRWTEELAGFQLAWLALLGAAYALRRGEHLGLDVLHQRLSPAARRRADVAVSALVALFSLGVLGYGGLRLVLMTTELHQRTPALGWPMAVIYSVVPVTGVILGLFAGETLLKSLREEPR
ncbi:MAG TPA: TRAP transporter small permease subunit, partial [Vicinamibacteria bacterium]|nr:TRAP transporter small permease subunit [Vicinamibacteria bacterium]